MKLNFSNRTSRAMTVFEVLVVVACLLVLAAVILPPFRRPCGCQKVNCVSNLKQVNLSFRIWEGDNANQYPMGVSVTNGGGMELIETGNVGGLLQVVSNEFSTTKIFVCPSDQNSTYATNWNDLNHLHVSYFIGVDVTDEDNPSAILDGDDNLIVVGLPVKSGIWALSSNMPACWSGTRHVHVGNIGLADGSVLQESGIGLQQSIQKTGLAKNRIAIP